jgi:hypothetical protein
LAAQRAHLRALPTGPISSGKSSGALELHATIIVCDFANRFYVFDGVGGFVSTGAISGGTSGLVLKVSR